MTDPRPRNNQGQFAPQEAGGIDPNTTSTAYDPQIIERRKASLIEKIRRMRGARSGVEESVPQREQVLSAKLRLRELSEWTQQEQDAYEKRYAEYLAGGSSAGLGRFDAKDPKTGKKYGGVITPDMYKRERQNPVPVMVRLTPAKAGGWDKKITPPDEFRQQMADYMEKQKTMLSAKLRLRELARQAYDPYAPKPAEPGQAGRDFRNAAIGIGALGAGGGVAYAGWRGAQAAQSAQTLTDDALKTSGEARKAARSARIAAARVSRAGKWARTQFTTFPTFKKVASKIFEQDLRNLRELAARSVELNSITYHETNADILRRKARAHREKRDEASGMWPYAVAAPGILAASPALRAESANRVASLGNKLWKGEHADNTAHLGNKVARVLRAHPGKVVSALALAPSAVLGGKLAYHTVAARSKDGGVNKELKLANEMRRQRNAEALKK